MRILLVDDHELFREGLKYLLAVLDSRVEFVEAGNIEDALRIAGGPQPDLILLDYHLPGTSRLDALKQIRATFESVAVVVLSGEEDAKIVRAAVDNGAAGFIPKSSSREILVNALSLVLAGGTYLPSSALQSSLPFAESASKTLGLQLSSRQYEVLMKVIQGKPNKIIARELDISDHTVKAHLSVAFRVLGVQNRTEAVYVAAKLGMHPTTQQAPAENQKIGLQGS